MGGLDFDGNRNILFVATGEKEEYGVGRKFWWYEEKLVSDYFNFLNSVTNWGVGRSRRFENKGASMK